MRLQIAWPHLKNRGTLWTSIRKNPARNELPLRGDGGRGRPTSVRKWSRLTVGRGRTRYTTPSHTPWAGAAVTFQERVHDWMQDCFGPDISADRTERNHRFLEESLELVQANGCTQSEARQLVGYVFSRNAGEPHQECGGVMVTLAALCLASDIDMTKAAEDELARVWKMINKIRAKQSSKPRHSPIPETPTRGPQ